MPALETEVLYVRVAVSTTSPATLERQTRYAVENIQRAFNGLDATVQIGIYNDEGEQTHTATVRPRQDTPEEPFFLTSEDGELQ